MTSASERLARHPELSAEPPDRAEYDRLVRSGLARLTDAENIALSLDSRFDLAYNAAHALCLAALRRRGFRAAKKAPYLVFQVLPDTIGLGADVWPLLSKCHDVRNRSEYEGVFDADAKLVTELIAACRKVAAAIKALPPLQG